MNELEMVELKGGVDFLSDVTTSVTGGKCKDTGTQCVDVGNKCGGAGRTCRPQTGNSCKGAGDNCLIAQPEFPSIDIFKPVIDTKI